eukprot:TRINITY_DN74472_c0_g1_i1.p1 TRINITY_DN74472_c0_g1~~TRINITY_DN74472_c0_g1_i1.p1  ORF type:complete len:815 (+),score=97.34 TRINITY_DN74472_c0_g1_i1:98-2542(+)
MLHSSSYSALPRPGQHCAERRRQCTAFVDGRVTGRVYGQLGEACSFLAVSRHADAILCLRNIRQDCPKNSSVAKLVDCVHEAVRKDFDDHNLSFIDTAELAPSVALQGRATSAETLFPSSVTPRRSVSIPISVTSCGTGGDDGTVRPPATSQADDCPLHSANVAIGTRGANAFKEAIMSVSCARRKLLSCRDKFVSVRLAVKYLRSLRDSLHMTATTHPLFLAPLLRLAREMDLLEVLLAAEFKISRLNGVGAFVELVRVDRLMAAYFGQTRFVDEASADEDDFSSEGGSFGQLWSSAVSTRSQPLNGSLPRRADRLHGSNASLVLPMPQVTASSQDKVEQNEMLVTRLEQRYLYIREHCARKLWFLCGSGFAEAARLSQRCILDPQTTPGAGSSTAIAGVSYQVEVDNRRSQDHRQQRTVPPCVYSDELAKLSKLPGVAFAGVFANAKQLPHAQAGCRHASSGGLGTPFQDCAWLSHRQRRNGSVPTERAMASQPVPKAGRQSAPTNNAASGAGGPENVGEFEWWALSFMTCRSPVQIPVQVGVSMAVEMGRCNMSGLEALDEWRQQPELKLLRAALTQACRRRHAEGPCSSSRALVADGPSSVSAVSGDALLGTAVNVPATPMILDSQTSLGNCRCLVLPLDTGWFASPLFVAAVMYGSKHGRTEAATAETASARPHVGDGTTEAPRLKHDGSRQAPISMPRTLPGRNEGGGLDGSPSDSPCGSDGGVSSGASGVMDASSADALAGERADRNTCVTKAKDVMSHLRRWLLNPPAARTEDVPDRMSRDEDPKVAVERLLWRIANLVSGRDLRG